MSKKKKLPPLKTNHKNARFVTKFFLGLLFLVFLFYPGQNYFQRLVVNPGQVKGETYTKESLTLPLVSKNFDKNLTAKAYMVFEPVSGTVLLENNSDKELTPASVTKIMTALVARDLYEDQDSLLIAFDRAEGNIIGLKNGTSVTTDDLLKALLISSANDAALALAQNHPAGYQGFVEDMNTKSGSIGLRHTHFTNVSGIGSKDHYTTVHDLVVLTKYALKDEKIKDIVKQKQAEIEDSKGKKYLLNSTNILLGQVPGLLGVKTGWTEEAGECLVSYANRDGREVIVAVLGSSDRFGETRDLIEWFYADTFDKTFD